MSHIVCYYLLGVENIRQDFQAWWDRSFTFYFPNVLGLSHEFLLKKHLVLSTKHQRQQTLSNKKVKRIVQLTVKRWNQSCSLGEDEGTLNRNCNKKKVTRVSHLGFWCQSDQADLVPVHQRNFNKEEFSSHVAPRILNDPEPGYKVKKFKNGIKWSS